MAVKILITTIYDNGVSAPIISINEVELENRAIANTALWRVNDRKTPEGVKQYAVALFD